MNILITGGAGFIGSNLIERLVQLQNIKNIISLDNYISGKQSNHIENEKVTYLTGSTVDINDNNTLKKYSPDIVFHFGEFSRIVASFENCDIVFKSNITGTIEVIKYCAKQKAKLIYSCSSSILGNNGEDAKLNPYSYCKKMIKDLIVQYSNWFELKYAICYFYNVYGNRQISVGEYATVIGIFEDQYINDQYLTIVAPGTQERYFTHINDIVSGLILLLNNDAIGDNYHIGSQTGYNILSLAKMFNHKYMFVQERKGERLSPCEPILEKISALGWLEKENLNDYINNFTKKIINLKIIIPVYNAGKYVSKCIQSILSQTYKHWTAIIIDDASTDDTYDQINKFTDTRLTVIKNNTNVKALANIISGIDTISLSDEDVIILIDGDDWLNTINAFQIIVNAYSNNNIFLTYGQYIDTRTKNIGCSREIANTSTYRTQNWRSSHLRTFKRHLFKKIKHESLLDENGNYFQSAWDLALMYPMIEMSGSKRIKYISDILYCYNNMNPLNDFMIRPKIQQNEDNYIRTQKPYDEI